MNTLDQYLVNLNNSNYDIKDNHKINSEFQQLIKQLSDEGKNEIALLADLDRQVFSVQKSFEKKQDIEKGTLDGLSWQVSGTQTLDDGTEIPLYWPDVTKYSENEFLHFENRYNESQNLYVKTEFGLMVYFGQKSVTSKHNDFKRKLCNELLELSKIYFAKAADGGEKNHYVLHYFHTLRMAFGVAENSKLDIELNEIIKEIYSTHQNWDVTKYGTLRILLDLSGLLSDHYSLSNKLIDFQKVLDKNLEGAKELEKTYVWGAIYAIDRNISIENKRNNSIDELLKYKAQLYEKLASEAESRGSSSGVNFVENALRIYQQLKIKDEIERLEKYYSNLRGQTRLSEVKEEMPKEYVDEMKARVLEAIENNNETGILTHFIKTPWYDSIESIKSKAIELRKQSVLLSIFPTIIMDKFGNTIDKFYSDDEKEKFNFWSTYTFNFQIGTQTMHMFFLEAYKVKKISYNSVLTYLEDTWFNEVIKRNYHGQIVEVKPIDTLKPALKRIFEELDKFNSDNTYRCEFVTITDSLTLKIEGLLRYFCEKTEIATFKTRSKGNDKLVMEKLLDDLLSDIAHNPPTNPDQITNFDEEDRILIKYVLSEKAGLNLRNTVAHGLMDVFEYTFENVLILFCIIIKLSKYKFIETINGDTNEDSIK